MNAKLFLAPALAVSTLGLGACAQNYGVEGAGLGAEQHDREVEDRDHAAVVDGEADCHEEEVAVDGARCERAVAEEGQVHD